MTTLVSLLRGTKREDVVRGQVLAQAKVLSSLTRNLKLKSTS